MSNWIKRKKTKVVNVGNVPVGGNNPISIQFIRCKVVCPLLNAISYCAKAHKKKVKTIQQN